MNKRESMLPLDAMLVALSGLVLYVVVSQLKFDDPRWSHNAWTYIVAIPLVALVLAILLHGVASRYVQKSIQVGFLFSVFVHLLLMMLAINIVIFSRYFPEVTAGVKPERSPQRKTVPEYLFRTPQESADTPDWSQPTEAKTTSRVVPDEPRKLPPLEHTASKLEMPREPKPQPVPLQKFLLNRDQPEPALPQPADSPGELARRRVSDENPSATQTPAIETPKPTTVSSEEPRLFERDLDMAAPSAQSNRRDRRTDFASAAPRDALESISNSASSPHATRAVRNELDTQPQVGDSGLTRQSAQPRRAHSLAPAGASVAPPSVAIASESAASHRVLDSVATPDPVRGPSSGALLSVEDLATKVGMSPSSTETMASQPVQGRASASEGVPEVASAQPSADSGRSGRRGTTSGFQPAGTPQAIDAVAAGRAKQGEVGRDISDRSVAETSLTRMSSDNRGSATPNLLPLAEPEPAFGIGPTLVMPLREGPVGLANRVALQAGVVPSAQTPDIAALELTRESRPRREVGGPAYPVGTKIASVESFSRRVMRTDGGAAPTPAGMVGPATEEAIERGLAYLSSTQNEDGSWSLTAHGEEVILDSHTAATGLCLLAFQGAGYTHLKHQYAETVSRGLGYLVTHQRSSGDLYVSENEMSDRNVSLYSHGIASLALCEAYGMTQDPELREPAQQAIRYITVSQHPERGGWRYTPGISSDTSVTGWMMMALKSGELAGLEVQKQTYAGIDKWLELAKESDARPDRYRYNPYAPDTPSQSHGRLPTPTMTAVGMLMRMYSGWRRDNPAMRSAAEYLLRYPPQVGTAASPQRDTYYWYYATQVMFHMGGKYWEAWNQALNPMLLQSQIEDGPQAGSWDPNLPVPDRWSPHAGRLYVTTMNLLNLEVYYRHLPIYEETAE